ncbi:PACE efflux transporter [Mangrovicoccus algicola]|uniref:PACE efflux transporter n=1 Tax=Mangrovicoccus algicola TaxID=2771008 RepID=A0A8J7CZ68_9RHOB|nr:PACE efflux transporter [Mangrovicoccus algicola]MBE3640482.1 PACE efflux transporter [Mangrovicoccus algicola]
MRTTRDRMRHAILFELCALALSAPLGAALFGVPVLDFGMLAVMGTTIAMGWTYLFNLGFDHALRRAGRPQEKTLGLRILHTLLFEGGLLVLLVPLIAWHLDVSLGRAFVMDVVMAGFYLLYTFAFNWGYDMVFPIPGEAETAAIPSEGRAA